MNNFEKISAPIGFEWDKANIEKNWSKHKVSPTECEQVFFSEPLNMGEDSKHSDEEKRFHALGQTDAGRFLFASFTIRNNRVRVISARDMSRKERRVYHNAKKINS